MTPLLLYFNFVCKRALPRTHVEMHGSNFAFPPILFPPLELYDSLLYSTP